MGNGQMQAIGPMDTRHLAQENDFLVVQFPPFNSAMVFSVKSVMNKGREFFSYGPLPTLTTTGVTSYDGGGGTAVPAAGTIAGREYTNDGLYFNVPSSGTFSMDQNVVDDNNNMWYLDPTKNHGNYLNHTLLRVTPAFLRLELQVPNGVRSFNFQDDLPGGIDKAIGYVRGFMNIAWLPGLRQSIRVGNDTNFQLYTSAAFKYRQYIVEVVRDAAVIFQILTRTFPMPHLVKWVTMPITIQDDAIKNAVKNTYGIADTAGFPFYPLNQRDAALQAYRNLISQLKEGA